MDITPVVTFQWQSFLLNSELWTGTWHNTSTMLEEEFFPYSLLRSKYSKEPPSGARVPKRESELFVALSSSEQQVLENTWYHFIPLPTQRFYKRIRFMHRILCPLGYITEEEIEARHLSELSVSSSSHLRTWGIPCVCYLFLSLD